MLCGHFYSAEHLWESGLRNLFPLAETSLQPSATLALYSGQRRTTSSSLQWDLNVPPMIQNVKQEAVPKPKINHLRVSQRKCWRIYFSFHSVEISPLKVFVIKANQYQHLFMFYKGFNLSYTTMAAIISHPNRVSVKILHSCWISLCNALVLYQLLAHVQLLETVHSCQAL